MKYIHGKFTFICISIVLSLSLFMFSCVEKVDTVKHEKLIYVNNDFRPNIVWITCEDIGPTIPMYGDSTIQTPNLDRLAREGVVFDNAFSVSGVCSPSRSCLITGMYPTSIGTHNHRAQTHTREEIDMYEVVPPDYVKCFTEYLRQEGYYCSNKFKTDYNFGGGIVKSPSSAFDNHSWNADWSGRKPGQPFFAIFNHQITHMSRLWKRNHELLRIDPDDVPVPPYFPETRKARTSIARLYDNIKILDSQVGELLQRLEREGLMDSTIVFFFSDHGDGLPRNKIWIYDSGIKVPFLIRFPNMWNAGTRNDDLISFVDFAPTVLALCGVDIPDHMQGNNFLTDIDYIPREFIYAAKDRIDFEEDRIRAVRDKSFKYIKNYFPERPYIQYFPWSDSIYLTQEWKRLYEIDSLNEYQKLFFRNIRPEEELYNIINDPYELKNLAGIKEYQPVLEKMRKENEQHIAKIHDLGFVSELKLKERYWPNGIQPVADEPEVILENGYLRISTTSKTTSIIYSFTTDQNNDIWDLYTSPIKIKVGDTIVIKAARYGFKDSPTVTFTL